MTKEQDRSTSVAWGELNTFVDAERAQQQDYTVHGWIKERIGGDGIEQLCKVRNKLSGTQAISLSRLVRFHGQPKQGLQC